MKNQIIKITFNYELLRDWFFDCIGMYFKEGTIVYKMNDTQFHDFQRLHYTYFPELTNQLKIEREEFYGQ